MTGMDCFLCKGLWILHLSRKTEAENSIFLAGIYEITAWEIHFWGYMCLCVGVREEEREVKYSSALGRQAIGFIRL